MIYKEPEFVSIWRTTTDDETITLPLESGGTYDFTVDWGDGSATQDITDHNASHEYSDPDGLIYKSSEMKI